MKNARRRDDGIIAAATILIAVVLLGCLATSVHCARVPSDVIGERRAEETEPQPFCYKTCGNGRCDFCCASDYTPTFCWESEAMCKHECHPPFAPSPAMSPSV